MSIASLTNSDSSVLCSAWSLTGLIQLRLAQEGSWTSSQAWDAPGRKGLSGRRSAPVSLLSRGGRRDLGWPLPCRGLQVPVDEELLAESDVEPGLVFLEWPVAVAG